METLAAGLQLSDRALGACDGSRLWMAYSNHSDQSLAFNLLRDRFLLDCFGSFQAKYLALPEQEQALRLGFSIWHKVPKPKNINQQDLLQFPLGALQTYQGYPHQREALLALLQTWHRFPDRATTIKHLDQGFIFRFRCIHF
ncbi:MAG: hypothetical protein HC796_09730 [Synechococcaceae cyanobacterium RL_1_2]|nr:hypothetical protein [Synechococcaceae cyanobacterium RL_1_2]